MKATARVLELLGIELPVIQAPMAGFNDEEMAIAVSEAGGLGSVPCARLTPEQLRDALISVRRRTPRPVNFNFFCHAAPGVDPERETAWRARLQPYYAELGIGETTSAAGGARTPFDEAMCDVLMEAPPKVVSFHFGLPAEALLKRVKSAGAVVLSSATTVEEARWLEAAGADAIIAQGAEAGGHRGMFLAHEPARQVGTMALVPQVVDAVKVPVIAAGGIGDARGIVAALALGAAAVQMGTAFLRCTESKATAIHRRALEGARDDSTVLTNVLSGRPARGLTNRLILELGPLSAAAPEFPQAAEAIAPLKARAEESGSGEFSALWAGQAAALAREGAAAELVRALMRVARQLLGELGVG
jgi:nitronate monooxygenase